MTPLKVPCDAVRHNNQACPRAWRYPLNPSDATVQKAEITVPLQARYSVSYVLTCYSGVWPPLPPACQFLSSLDFYSLKHEATNLDRNEKSNAHQCTTQLVSVCPVRRRRCRHQLHRWLRVKGITWCCGDISMEQLVDNHAAELKTTRSSICMK